VTGARIGVWGTSDVDNYGDQLFAPIARAELLRRLPTADVRAYAPLGRLHPTPVDDDPASIPLGAWSEARVAELALELDCVVIGGGELLHLNDPLLAPVYGVDAAEMNRLAPSSFFVEGLGPAEPEVPVIWHGLGIPFDLDDAARVRIAAALADRPYVTVRDERSRHLLVDAGATHAIVVPDSVFLLPRLFSSGGLDRATNHLRSARAIPPAGRRYLALQGCDLLVPQAAAIAEVVDGWCDDHPDHDVVLVATGRARGDEQFADAVASHLRVIPRRMPPAAGIEEIAAVIAGADGFVGSSLHGNITAFTYGRPFVVLNLAPERKLEGFARLAGPDAETRLVHDVAGLSALLDPRLAIPPERRELDRLTTAVDLHFDRVATIAANAVDRRAATRGTRRGLASRSRRRIGRLLNPRLARRRKARAAAA